MLVTAKSWVLETLKKSELFFATKVAMIRYRPDIDALRAIAVVAVIVYHLFPTALPGGFLGVDIFFVISGFLIGGQIFKAASAGEFRFIHFYARRFRRLAPALGLVLASTSVAAILTFGPNALAKFGEYLLAATLGVSNFRFIFDTPYEFAEATTNPLLHTWSLGVEEQFYLLAPVMVLLAVKLRRRSLQTLFFIGVFLTSLLSTFLIPVMFSEQANFYGLPSRAWELLAGVILATTAAGNDQALTVRTKSVLAGVGFSMIVVSIVTFDELSSGPQLLSLVPVIGTVLVILGEIDNPVSALIARKPVIYLGLISYPLYLWHFPILALIETIGNPKDAVARTIGAMVAIGLAAITFHKIEQPIRRGLAPRRWVPKVFVLLVLSGISGAIFIGSAGFPARVSSMPLAIKPQGEDGPREWAEGPGKPILLLGDSQMRTLIPAVTRIAENLNRPFSSYTEVGCQFILGVEKARKLDGHVDPRCDADSQSARLDWINIHGPATVIIGGRLPLILEGDRFDNLEGGYEGPWADYIRFPGTEQFELESSRATIEKAYSRTVSELLRHGHQVVLIYPIPEAGWDVPETLSRRTLFSGNIWPPDTPLTTSYEVFLGRTESSYALLDSLRGEEIRRVYPELAFCNDSSPGRCTTHDDLAIFYTDEHHLSENGAERIGRLLETTFE